MASISATPGGQTVSRRAKSKPCQRRTPSFIRSLIGVSCLSSPELIPRMLVKCNTISSVAFFDKSITVKEFTRGKGLSYPSIKIPSFSNAVCNEARMIRYLNTLYRIDVLSLEARTDNLQITSTILGCSCTLSKEVETCGGFITRYYRILFQVVANI